jgi:hypothetical protein
MQLDKRHFTEGGMTYLPWMRSTGAPREFGVEMELTRSTTSGDPLTGDMIKAGLRNARVPRLNRRAPGYYHSDGTSWDVKADSSCGWEIASPKLTLDENGECQQLDRACVGLASVSPRINHTCGLHVHVDLHDFDWRDMQRLIALWARYEPFFFEITPPSRRGNSYCSPIRASTWASLSRPTGPDRRWWAATQVALAATDRSAFQNSLVSFPRGAINVAHFIRSGRVEFRLQGGTISYQKIRNWVILLLAVVNRAKTTLAPPVALTINQPRPELGFGTRYVFQILGMAPSRWAPVVAPICATIETWANERRAALVGTNSTLTF